ncbi:MAG: DoxX family protein [Tuberibacillus sp.]
MFIKFIRETKVASYLLLIIRFYLGFEWMKSGLEKLTTEFDATGYLMVAVKSAGGEHPAVQGWWAAFLKGFAIPNANLFNFLVPWGELLVGIGLIVGGMTTIAAFMGIVMNFAYMFSGTTSTNPQMVLLTIFVLVAGANAARIGLDYWIHKWFAQRDFKIFHRKNHGMKGQHS